MPWLPTLLHPSVAMVHNHCSDAVYIKGRRTVLDILIERLPVENVIHPKKVSMPARTPTPNGTVIYQNPSINNVYIAMTYGHEHM